MINRYEYQGVTWIDVESPTPAEVVELESEFTLGPLVAEELMAPTLKPHVDLYPKFAYAVLHFPSSRHTGGKSISQEVDIIIGHDFIITVHYDTIAAIYDFSRSFEAATLLKRVTGKLHSGHVLFELAERLYQSAEAELDSIEDSVSEIERAIYSGREREMVRSISGVSRELLSHKRTLGTHRDALDSLEQAGVTLFGDTFRNYLRGITAFHFRVYNRVTNDLDTMSELRETNNSLLSTRQNEITKNLTVVASIMLPLTLITQMFSMNTADTPIVGAPNDFLVLASLMVMTGAILFIYFKIKRWF